MAHLRNGEAAFRWLRDHLVDGHLTPGRGYSGDTIRTNTQGHLMYVRSGKEGTRPVRMRHRWNPATRRHEQVEVQAPWPEGHRTEFGPVKIAVYVPSSKTFLLNGDGFEDEAATRVQTWLRNVIQRPQGGLQGFHEDITGRKRVGPLPKKFVPKEGSLRYVIVPFLALTGADVDPLTVRPIEVTLDTWENITYEFPNPPTKEEFDSVKFPKKQAKVSDLRHRVVTKNNTRFRVTESYHSRLFRGKEMLTNNKQRDIYETTSVNGHPDFKRNASGQLILQKGITRKLVWLIAQRHISDHAPRILKEQFEKCPYTVEVYAQGETWQGFRWSNLQVNHQNGNWYFQENVHRLGSSLFSAVGEDGRRHKFISSFDTQERQPLYFLAQLPDGSGAKTVEQAIAALAPPIVHKAREEKRLVFRQGDVFAIETKLNEEQVYAMAHTRVRREVVLVNGNTAPQTWLQVWLHRDLPRELQRPLQEGEVFERITCPCGCKRYANKVGFGPAARRALSVYRTGHTATEVVTTKKGVTYVRGSLFHNPEIETEGRVSEHQEVRLGEEGKWFLCTRNTVPRSNRPAIVAIPEMEESEAETWPEQTTQDAIVQLAEAS